jgi:hypothetical protein
MSPKLISILLFGIAGIAFGIGRWFSNNRSSNFTKKLIKALNESPDFAGEVAIDHANLYAKAKNNSTQTLNQRLDFIKVNSMLFDKFQILGKYPLENDGVLLITMCHNIEQGESQGSEVIKKFALNFVVKHNKEGEIEVCSDYFAALMDKILRQDFANSMINTLVKNG